MMLLRPQLMQYRSTVIKLSVDALTVHNDAGVDRGSAVYKVYIEKATVKRFWIGDLLRMLKLGVVNAA